MHTYATEFMVIVCKTWLHHIIWWKVI